MNVDLKSKFENLLINNINNKLYNNKEKNKIKRFLIKIQCWKKSPGFNQNNNNCFYIYNNYNNESNANYSDDANDINEENLKNNNELQ